MHEHNFHPDTELKGTIYDADGNEYNLADVLAIVGRLAREHGQRFEITENADGELLYGLFPDDDAT